MTQPPIPQPYAPAPPPHPQATTVLVLGILGIVVCGVLGPFAWVIGNRTVAEIDAAGGRLGGRTEANVGRILGMVASALLILSVLVLGLFLLIFVVGGVASTGSSFNG